MKFMGIGLLYTVALFGCSPPQQPGAIAPDLLEVYDQVPLDERVRVLVVHPGVQDVSDRIDRSGGRIVQRFEHVPVTVVELTRDEADELASHPGLHLVTDRDIKASGSKTTGVALSSEPDLVAKATGADRVLAGATGSVLDGTGVVVAIVDSGVDENHKDFPKKVLADYADFVDGDDVLAKKDPYGHGTMVAGVLAGTRSGAKGVAPGVKLVSARVLGADGSGSTSDAVEAVDWLIDEQDEAGLDVIHFSIGAAPYESFTSDPLAQAVEAALEAGIVVVGAAGNYGSSDGQTVYGGIVSPANHPGVITVGAMDPHGTAKRSDDSLAAFSSRGPTLFDGLGKPDLVAPGVDLPLLASSKSTLWTEHPEAQLASLNGAKMGDYLVASGTSFAAPAVTGAVAMILQAHPGLSPAEVKALLEVTASDVGDTTLLGAGAGALNTAGAVRLARWNRTSSLAMQDTLSGETVSWGLTLLWDGYDTSGEDLTNWNTDGVLAVGDLGGSGIMWDGTFVRYVGVKLSGTDLVYMTTSGWLADITWGNGIMWDGGFGYRYNLGGLGIMWDGGLNHSTGGVWQSPGTTWGMSLIWPSNLSSTGVTSPLFTTPSFSGLTVPVAGADSPYPAEADFGN